MRADFAWSLAAWALLAGPGAQPSAAQDAAHARVAGCYAWEATPEAPWLGELGHQMRLSLDPVATEPGSSPQFAVELAPGRRTAYPYMAWSLVADGPLVSVTWTSAADQVGLVFEPAPRSSGRGAIGTTTFFTHETGATTPPIDVRVTPIAC